MGFQFQLLLPVIGVMFILSVTAGQDQRGTEFMLSFIDPRKNEGNIVLLISAEDTASVTITVPFLDQRLTKDLEPGETWKPSMSLDLRYKAFFTIVPSAVNVTSTSPVTVYVYDGFGIRSSGFMALPLHALSTSYIAVTYNGETDRAYPVLLLVAIMNDTIVDVVYRLSNGQCDVHTNGQTSSHTLHAYDVYGVQCTGDFTGTYVVSNKPLVVISGHQKTNVSGSNFDSLQEMLIPVDQFGHSFVLTRSSKGSINRIVSSSDNTTVISSIGETFFLNAYEYMDIDTDINGQQCINSNYPVLVVSFTKSSNGEKLNERLMDAAMYIVPATSMFTTSIYVDYGLASVLHTDEFVSIAFVFSRNDTPTFSSLTTVHEVIPSCPYDVYKMTVTTWPVVFSEGSLKFGAYLYGSHHTRFNGAALPLNMNFGNKEVASPSSSYQSYSTSCCFPSSSLSFSSSFSFPLSSSSSFTPFLSSSSSSSLSSLLSTASYFNSPFHFSFPSLTSYFPPSSLSPSSPPSSFVSSSPSSISLSFLLSHLPSFSSSVPSSLSFSSSLSYPYSSYSSLSPPPFSSPQASISSSSSLGVYEETSSVCGCLCMAHAPWNITDELFQMLREEIIQLLLLEPKNLSKTTRKLTSAQDNRPSAVAIGTIGTTFIVLAIILIFVPDVISVLRYVFANDRTHPKVVWFVRNVK